MAESVEIIKPDIGKIELAAHAVEASRRTDPGQERNIPFLDGIVYGIRVEGGLDLGNPYRAVVVVGKIDLLFFEGFAEGVKYVSGVTPQNPLIGSLVTAYREFLASVNQGGFEKPIDELVKSRAIRNRLMLLGEEKSALVAGYYDPMPLQPNI